jgi:outer membrane protein insertion porin family
MVKRWLSIGLLVALASAMLQSVSSRAESETKSSTKPVRISDILICGNQRISTEQIKAKLLMHVGDEYKPAIIEEDVRQLNEIHHISIAATMKEDDGPNRVKIYFVICELGGKVQKVTFRGAKHLKEEELRNLTDIHPGTPLAPYKNRLVCTRIEAEYMEMGWPQARCRLVKGGDLNDTEVIFDITEGPKVKVKDIKFLGNTFASGARLVAEVQSSHEGFACVSGTYNNGIADNDCKALMDYYRKSGFFDVKVSLERQPSDDDREVTLIFHIHEGPRQKAETGALPVRVGQIIVIGNKRISSESILAHVPLFPDQVLSYPDLKEAEKRLAELGLFVVDPAAGVHPTITVLDPDGDNPYKDIRITVQEKPNTKQKSR